MTENKIKYYWRKYDIKNLDFVKTIEQEVYNRDKLVMLQMELIRCNKEKADKIANLIQEIKEFWQKVGFDDGCKNKRGLYRMKDIQRFYKKDIRAA